MKSYTIELCYVLALLPSIFTKQFIGLGIEIGLPWTMNYVLIWIAVLIFALSAGVLCLKNLKGRIRFFVATFALIIPLVSYFAANPIYEGDFNKLGSHVDYGTENLILQDILCFKAEFKGVVCVASPSCPYCIEAVRDKIRFIHKRGKVDAAVYLPQDDGSNFKNFRAITQASDLDMLGNSRPDIGFDIDENVIPIFLYIRDGKIVHVWRNDQLGYPALDWIESDLK
jgi:hypothetical protein